jgi:hypothetical protein
MAQLDHLEAWVGEWETEATHPMLPDTVVPGRITVEWLEGEKFLLHRARNDHPDLPDSISVIGDTRGGRGQPDDALLRLARGVPRLPA